MEQTKSYLPEFPLVSRLSGRLCHMNYGIRSHSFRDTMERHDAPWPGVMYLTKDSGSGSAGLTSFWGPSFRGYPIEEPSILIFGSTKDYTVIPVTIHDLVKNPVMLVEKGAQIIEEQVRPSINLSTLARILNSVMVRNIFYEMDGQPLTRTLLRDLPLPSPREVLQYQDALKKNDPWQ